MTSRWIPSLFRRWLVLPALTPWLAVAAADEPPRPTVGLVLGGGGALGYAHIGVLRVLEELRVPIDCIAGTSMGAIIGGLYASGMGPDEIQTFLGSLDWNDVLRDETPRNELFFRRKMDDQRFLLQLGLGRSGIKLPSGVAAGQKFNNLMEFITLRVAGITDFDELPVPYRAVATDLRSGEAVVIGGGRLSRAMRASMAVPGVFTPVELDGHLLIDGGVVNNLPVDVAEALGADVIIAVDVAASSDRVDEVALRSFLGILGRTYNITSRPGQLEQLKRADVGLQPDLNAFNAAQFDRVADIAAPGETAARARAAELARFGVDAETYHAYLSRHRRTMPQTAVIRDVIVTGARRVDEDIIAGRIRSRPGDPAELRVITQDLQRVYGIDEFEQVQVYFDPHPGGGADLTFDVKEKPWGPLYLNAGIRLRSDFDKDADWSILLNVTRMSVNRLGAEWRNEAQLGSTLGVLSEFYQPLEAKGWFFLAPSVELRSELQDVYQEDRRIAEYDVSQWYGGFDLGIQLRQYAELRMGPLWGRGEGEVETGTAELPEIAEDVSGWRVALTLDRQDRTVFPRKGYQFGIEGRFVGEALGGDAEFDKVQGLYRGHRSVGNHTFSLGLDGGTSLGSELPAYAEFTLGGPFGFAGLAEFQFRGSYLAVASLGYRYRLLPLPSQVGRGIYAVFRADGGNVWTDGIDTEDLRYGGSIGLGADTAAGPILLAYGRADEDLDRFYFTLGSAF